MNKKVKKGIDIGTIVLACILFLLGAAILTLTVTKNTTGVPRLFGVTFLDVQTDSMQGTINPGDVAVVTKVKSVDNLKKGDIITFWTWLDTNSDGQKERVLNTHRIIEIDDAVEPNIYTQGDKEGLGPDENATHFGDVVGVYQFRLPALGFVIRFFQTPVAFGLLVILPLAAFLGYRIYVLARVLKDMKKEKAVAEGNDPDILKKELEALRAQVAILKGDDENK